MPSNRSRRSALRLCGTALVASLAGCPGLGDDGTPTPTPTPDPDAGRDAYGVVVENTTEDSQTVGVTVQTTFGESVPLEETVTLGAGESRSWNSVVTEPKEYAVIATLPEVTQMDDAIDEVGNEYTFWIEVGGESEPPAPDVHVTVEMSTVALSSADKTEAEVPSVRINWPEAYRTTAATEN